MNFFTIGPIKGQWFWCANWILLQQNLSAISLPLNLFIYLFDFVLSSNSGASSTIRKRRYLVWKKWLALPSHVILYELLAAAGWDHVTLVELCCFCQTQPSMQYFICFLFLLFYWKFLDLFLAYLAALFNLFWSRKQSFKNIFFLIKKWQLNPLLTYSLFHFEATLYVNVTLVTCHDILQLYMMTAARLL